MTHRNKYCIRYKIHTIDKKNDEISVIIEAASQR